MNPSFEFPLSWFMLQHSVVLIAVGFPIAVVSVVSILSLLRKWGE